MTQEKVYSELFARLATLFPDERRHLLSLLEQGSILDASRTPDACGFTGETLPDCPSDTCSGSLKPFTHLKLDQYLIGACKEKKAVLIAQDKQAREDNSITCGCGWRRWIGYAYRCLYCGEWYCGPCAETHFGKSIEAWTIKNRVAKRRELEARLHSQSNDDVS